MKFFCSVCALLLLCCVGCRSDAQSDAPLAPFAVPAAPPVAVTAPALLSLDPNLSRFPRASQADFSDLVPAPAGGKGFLQTRGAHFVWGDGTRARFWGINVANSSLQESDADIVKMIQSFRAAGFNLVRLHHFDERQGIIDLDAPDSRQFNAANWRKLDFWIAKARENGLYVYLDLLDYRRFKEADGVKNAEAIGRSAKPYAVFDPRLIELQKEYARQLMVEHINPYTGKSYAHDPCVVMLELYDENGLFMRRGLWRSMPQPYASRFKKMWNIWLRDRYGTTAKLRAAWLGPNGQSALFAGESLENGSVELPAQTWEVSRLPAAEQPYANPARRGDGARFAVEIHRRYFREMKSYLRQIGIGIPLCATGRYDDVADLSSQARELDFIGCNFYYDHPYWGTGKPQWTPPSYFHGRNPMTDVGDHSMTAALGLARVRGKPLVVREWNYCWPNVWRGSGMLEAATFANLHDLDALILFTYETDPKARVGYFNIRSDPARWGMAAIGARMFLGAMVAPAKHRVVVPYSETDIYSYEKFHQPLYALGWTTRVENDFFEGDTYRAPPGVDLIVPPGRSVGARYTGAPALLYTRDARRNPAGHAGRASYWSDYGLAPGAAFDVKRLSALGLEPLTVTGQSARGFWDKTRRRVVYAQLKSEEVWGAALQALQKADALTLPNTAGRDTVLRADTGQVQRDVSVGRLAVDAPQVQVLAGDLSRSTGFAGGLTIKNFRQGALVAIALDGLPLASSRRYLIKMSADAINVDQKVERDPRFAANPTGSGWSKRSATARWTCPQPQPRSRSKSLWQESRNSKSGSTEATGNCSLTATNDIFTAATWQNMRCIESGIHFALAKSRTKESI